MLIITGYTDMMLGCQLKPAEYLARCASEFAKLDLSQSERLAEDIFNAYTNDRFVFLCGNGGSGSNCSHFCEDLGKSSLNPKDFMNDNVKRLKVLSLTDNVGWLTAVANDLDYDQVFVQQLMNYGSAGDLLLAISGSGNSANVLNAVDWANRHQLATFGLTGYDGGQLKQIQQDGLHLQLDDMGMVESIHLCLFHWVLNDLFARINRCGRYADE